MTMLLDPYRFGGAGGGGTEPGTVSIANGSYSETVVDPVNAEAFFQLAADRTASGGTVLESGDDEYDWLSADGNPSLWEVRLTMTSGTFTGPAANVWHNLGSTRRWEKTRTIPGTVSATGLIEIRPAGGGATVDSATISLTADVTEEP